MSCWVVPTIAAELWGISVEQVLGEIRAGTIPYKLDYGFTVVDVAPDSRELAPPPMWRLLPAPTTFVPTNSIANDELVTLSVEPEAPVALTPAEDLCLAPAATPDWNDAVSAAAPVVQTISLPIPAQSQVEEIESEDGPDPNDGEPDDGKPLNWRAARARSATMRRRPPARFS